MSAAKCSCTPIDGWLLKRQSGCMVHGPCVPRETPKPEPVELTDEQADRACAWADYRKDYGVPSEHLTVAYMAFMAGWKAAREGDQAGVLR